ncbi:polymorphic toxin-type HINT domain-containing protein [uncultured Roseobacter sp.]|uniref:polymorphic toxin-type HINT domain-containing protein n=1 Tax=uncultured Roseobacter sp. TaxID=114847 RepID=UPI002617D488|nr:polymorphic toxin-type HINT domain-containing protein [uncultured Roseobacter sp.]
MKPFLVIALAFLIWLPGPEGFDGGEALAQSSLNNFRNNQIYRDTLRSQERARQIQRERQRADEQRRRDEAKRQQRLQRDNARKLREAARLRQREALEKIKRDEAKRLQQQQAIRARQEREKRKKSQNKIALRTIAFSRALMRQRLAALPKPTANNQAARNVVVAKPFKPRPKRETVASLRPPCSFHGDTLVLTDVGMIPIRDIRVGEHRVWSRDEYTGETGWKDVLAHYSNEYDETVYVSIFDPDTGQTQTIVSNRVHPFFGRVPDEISTPLLVGQATSPEYALDGAWIKAADLPSGTLLLSSDETWDEVVAVSVQGENLAAFNLTVDKFHTFYVSGGANHRSIWVHNDCWDQLPEDFKKQIRAFTSHGHQTYKGNNGKIVYASHDRRRFYELAKHPPTIKKGDWISDAASEMNWERTGKKFRGEEIFRAKKNVYYSYDSDGHKGGVWKRAKSPEHFGKDDRDGTYDADLNWKAD